MNKIQAVHGVTWFALCALTLLGSMLSSFDGEVDGAPQFAGIAILAIAFVKAALVMWRFMELKHMPFVWRVVFLCWVAALFFFMVLGYWGVLFSLFS